MERDVESNFSVVCRVICEEFGVLVTFKVLGAWFISGLAEMTSGYQMRATFKVLGA